jgi:hypothetical protein
VCAVAQALVRAGRRVLGTTCTLVVPDRLPAQRDLTLRALRKRRGQDAALRSDDRGAGPQSREALEVLCTLLAARSAAAFRSIQMVLGAVRPR